MNYIQKIHLLISHRRFPEAERETRLALTDEPLEPILHMFLAVCLLQDDKRLEEATQEAQQAVGLDPEDPAYHYVLASTLLKRHRRAEARRSFEDALRLNPASSQYWSGLADLELQEARWQAALDAANQGLQVDPEDSDCLNCRTIALERLGRGQEAISSAKESLRQSPHDARSHAAAGWTELNNGNYKEAQIHFREALRLDPTDMFAKSGMVSALNSRYLLFRMFHRFNVWITRFSGKYQFLIVMAIWFLPKLLAPLANTESALGVIISLIRIMLISFVILSWLAEPLFNLVLRLNNFGKYLLTPKEVWCSNLVGAYVGGAIVSLSLGILRDAWAAGLLIAAYWLLCTLVTCIAFAQPNWQRTRIATGAAIVIALLPVYGGVLSIINDDASFFFQFFSFMVTATIVAQIAHLISLLRRPTA